MPRGRGSSRTSSSQRRVRRYKSKWTSHVIPRRFKRLVFEPPFHSLREFDEKAPPYVECEEPTMEELEAKGVPEEDWPYYLGYMKRMLELYRNFTSATLALEKESLIEEYVLRGYDREVLEQVQIVAEECAGLMVLVFRDYMYWFKDFSRVEDVASASDGTGYFTENPEYLRLATGVNMGSHAMIWDSKFIFDHITTWDKERVFQAIMQYGGAAPINPDIFIACGAPPGGNGFGFRITGNTLFGISSDGVGMSTVNLGAIPAVTYHSLVAALTPASKVEFYRNGTRIDEVTGNIPNGAVQSGYLCGWSIENLVASDLYLDAVFFEMWQQRPARLLE